MRFDYHPPTTKFKSFHLRRLFLSYMVLIGIGCIIFTLFSHNTNNSELTSAQDSLSKKRPVVLSKSKHKSNSSATLNLENKTTVAAKTPAKLDLPPPVAVAPAPEPILAPKATNSGLAIWQTCTVQ